MARSVSTYTPGKKSNNNGGRHATPASPGSGAGPAPGSQDSVTTEAVLARLAKAKNIEADLEALTARTKADARGRKASPAASGAADEKEQ